MRLKSRRGFTLIEMLIVLVMLAGITLMTAQTLNKALRAKRKIQTEIDQTSVMRDALRIMERDINMAFHYRNVKYEVLRKIKDEGAQVQTGQQANPAPGFPPPAPAPVPAPTAATPTTPTPQFDLKDPPPNYTHFLGENDTLYFTTLSHVRTLTDSPESDQAEVGYYIKNCRRRVVTAKDKNPNSRCLWRKEALYIDNDLTQGGNATPILENVEKFELLYFGEERDGWQKVWRTDEKGTEDVRGRFPQAVQIKLTTADVDPASKKKYSMILVAALRFPNNPVQPNKPQRKDTPDDRAKINPSSN